MNSSKLIDFSKSSLVGLKSELFKKQEEVRRIKELQQDGVEPEVKIKKKLSSPKLKQDKPSTKDTIQEDFSENHTDELRRSRELLEAKSKLYDKLKTATVDESTKSKYLVDFDLKNDIDSKESKSFDIPDTQGEQSDLDNHSSNSGSDSENDWVDFMDSLGRSRRCLRKDLPEMKEKDAKLAATIRPASPPASVKVESTPDLLSWDMQREMMRKKWEEQEMLLLGKKDIHYQNVRFDEARDHGVGYFEFSVDENERLRQQEALKRLRTQTVEQQQAAAGLRLRRQQQLAARLAAAKKRRRERLGLPPEEENEPLVPMEVNEEKIEGKEENVEDIEENIKRLAPVRPWDIGKEGVNSVMSQEEWVEKKRQERPEEFAPPSSLLEVDDVEESQHKKVNFFTSRSKKKLKKKFSADTESQPSNDNKPAFNQPPTVEESKEYFVQSNPPLAKSSIWKPTPEQIDLLLSKAEAECFVDNKPNKSSSNTDKYASLSINHPPSNINPPKSKQERFGINDKQQFNVPIHNEIEEGISVPGKPRNAVSSQKRDDSSWSKRKWAQIAPPASMDYYASTNSARPNTTTKKDLADSISVGLDYLKSRTDEKDSKRIKGLLDIV